MNRALVLGVLLAAGARAQDGPPPPAPPPAPVDEAWADLGVGEVIDPSTLARDTLRALAEPDSVLGAYRADPAFQYDSPEAAGPSLWERFWAWVARTFILPVFDNTTASFRQWVLVLLGVVALAWVVTRLLRAEGSGLFGRADRARAEAGPLLDVEDIARADVRSLLDGALVEGDFREAVRYRYLLVLQALDAAGALAWRRDKTNREYLAEVRDHDAARARPFAQATRVFEYVWYGERAVDAARFEALTPLFDGVEAGLAVAAR